VLLLAALLMVQYRPPSRHHLGPGVVLTHHPPPSVFVYNFYLTECRYWYILFIIMASQDAKLDLILSEMASLKKSTAEIALLVTRVNTLETTVAAQQATINALNTDVKNLKDLVNFREQQHRSSTIRVFNFPGSDAETNLATKVYDRLFKPILAAAKQKGDLATLPQVGTTIENIYRAGKFAAGANKPPPPIVVKLSSTTIRMALLRNKRLNTPPPPEGGKRLVIAEDLTPATYKKYRELLSDDRVEKGWTIDGGIYIVKKSDKSVIRVRSAYDSIDEILG